MVKYVMAAILLKLFSTSPPAKQLYRKLGNTYGMKRRISRGLPAFYVNRAKQIIQLCKKYQAIQDGETVLEIGTGWVHWESIIMRLFYDIKACAFDVWDNRQMEAVRHYFRDFEVIVDKEIEMDLEESRRVHSLLESIQGTKSFEEVYDLLGLRYVVDDEGSLNRFEDESFNLIVSSGVLEHVHESRLLYFVKEIYRLLKPNGYSIHHIVLGDHLAFYDKSVSKKNYLQYSDSVWKRRFENSVQYFNRVQRPEWIDIFECAGLEPVEEFVWTEDIGSIEVDKKYQKFGRNDLECTILKIVHKKSA